MITITPAALSGTALVANQVSVGATITEKLCRTCCVNSSIQPKYTVEYTYGTPVLNGTTVFVPITAIITIILSNCNNGCLTSRIYTEDFTLAFQGVSALPSAVTITSLGRTGNFSSIRCCKANNYTINDSLTVAITTA